MIKQTRTQTPPTEHPSSDERYKAIDLAMKRFNHEKDALLEVLNVAQETFGYLSEDLLTYVSRRLDVSAAHVYSTATFYELFTLKPTGDHHCLICTDPACAAAGGEDVLAAAKSYAQMHELPVTVEAAHCLGLCDQAPAALIDQTAQVNLQADDITGLFAGEKRPSRLQVTGNPQILTRHIGQLPPTSLDEHRADGAFTALAKALTQMTETAVIDEIIASGLAGRGGAGFPTGLKLRFTRQAPGTSKHIICNFDESEPGTFKDRVLMEGDPFQTLEGMILCGYAVGADRGTVFVRGEYPQATQILQEAIDALYKNNLLGANILNTGFQFDITIRRGAGAYICGEETALFEAIEGNHGFPRLKPPFPTTHGLFNKPTAINNVETLALIPHIILNGGQWLRQWGDGKSIGVKLFCLSGHVHQPGVIEAPFGITVRELIEQYGGGFDGEPQAILIGGAAGSFLHPDHLDTPLTNEALAELGMSVGSGVVMVFNQTADLLDILKTIATFFVDESCGQCTPCRIGTVQIRHMLDKITSGEAKTADLDKLARLCTTVKTASLCGLGQSAPNPVLSTLKYFHHEYEALVGK